MKELRTFFAVITSIAMMYMVIIKDVQTAILFGVFVIILQQLKLK